MPNSVLGFICFGPPRIPATNRVTDLSLPMQSRCCDVQNSVQLLGVSEAEGCEGRHLRVAVEGELVVLALHSDWTFRFLLRAEHACEARLDVNPRVRAFYKVLKFEDGCQQLERQFRDEYGPL